MNFSNFKISAKLGMGLATIVLLAALIGVLAIFQMGRIDDEISEMSQESLPTLNLVGEVQTVLNDMRRAELQHVVASSADEKKPEAERIAANIAKLAEFGKKLEAHMNAPSERQVIERYKQELEAYLATTKKLVELSSAGPTGLEATVKYLKGDSRTTFRAIFKSLNDMSASSTKAAEESASRAHQAQSNGTVNVAVVLSVAIVLAIVLGVWISRQITRPIIQAVHAAKEFAGGNLAGSLKT